MKLSQAFGLIQQRKKTGTRRRTFLACGFQPLHLATFLQAHFADRFEDEGLDLSTGLFGDLTGSVHAAVRSGAVGAFVVVEWNDLDGRLGLRSSGPRLPSVERDIVATAGQRFADLLNAVGALAAVMPVALALPTLSLTLLGHTTGRQISPVEAELERLTAEFACQAAKLSAVGILHPARLGSVSPISNRADPRMELGAGFPYSMEHASALALELTHLLFPENPLKGLITDLDDTLWSGIVGEVGAQNVAWSLADHAPLHGLYQQELRKLSEMGVLLAVVSKNDATVAESALSRADMVVPRDAFYPVYAAWTPKSISVGSVLQQWNIGQESVVFVDDSPMELDEVHAAFPGIACLRFPTGNPPAVMEFLGRLRDLFGKPELQREDAIRLSSIRSAAVVREAEADGGGTAFVRQLHGKVVFNTQKDIANKRLPELINKTNQFNLNGRRISEGEWMSLTSSHEGFVVGVSYEDKFGPLGTIAVVAGEQFGSHLIVSSWVMSCRAFARRIEFHTLRFLFDRFGVETIALRYRATERNEPLRQFLSLLEPDKPAPNQSEPNKDDAGNRVLSEQTLVRIEDELPHAVQDATPVLS